MKYWVLSVVVGLIIFTSCKENTSDMEQLKKEVWETIKAHNKTWSVDENIDEQMKFISDDMVGIFPPFNTLTKGKEAYREGYLSWYEHAKVHYFREVDPVITIHKDGFAIVAYKIEMSFDYDDNLVDDWKGMDMFTLVKTDGKWLITSDMFARGTE